MNCTLQKPNVVGTRNSGKEGRNEKIAKVGNHRTGKQQAETTRDRDRATEPKRRAQTALAQWALHSGRLRLPPEWLASTAVMGTWKSAFLLGRHWLHSSSACAYRG